MKVITDKNKIEEWKCKGGKGFVERIMAICIF